MTDRMRIPTLALAFTAAVVAGCASSPSSSPSTSPPTAPASAPIGASISAPASAPSAATRVSGGKAPVLVKVLAINDFHGNLKAPPGGIRIANPANSADPGNSGNSGNSGNFANSANSSNSADSATVNPVNPANAARRINVPAGGVQAMATLLDQLRAKNPNHIFVAAGDLIGATPLLSSLFRDEPSIEAMNLMGMEAAAMGNHELDRGPAELLRLQGGGCHPVDGCKGPQPFAGAKFQYLAANTVVQASGKTLLPPYIVKRFEGIPVAFIGLTLKGTPAVVVPSSVAGLRFDDEADTVNALVPLLQAQGIEAIVVLIHEGGFATGGYNDCPGISGAIVGIVQRMSRAVDVVVSGHTHTAYNCVIDGRLVTSADRYGTIVTQIDLVLDPQTRDVISAKADNVIVSTADFAPHPRLTQLVDTYETLVRPLAQRKVTTLAAPLTARVDEGSGESPMGQVIADAQLFATREQGAQLAMMNPGGVRGSLGGEGKLDVAYEDVFSVQPFYNQLVTLTLSGAQLLQLLEQPLRGARARPLFISRSLSYTWDSRLPPGQRVLPESLRLNGQPVKADQRVRITVNNFIADGGEDMSVLRQGQDRRPGPIDVDALEAYLKANPGLAPDMKPRITRLQ